MHVSMHGVNNFGCGMSVNVYWAITIARGITTIYTQFLTLIYPLTWIEMNIFTVPLEVRILKQFPFSDETDGTYYR